MLAHQGETLFGLWLVDDAWVALVARKVRESVYAGSLYEVTGPALGAVPFDASRVTRREVGSAQLVFRDAQLGTFSWRRGELSNEMGISKESRLTCTSGAQSNLSLARTYDGHWWAAPAGSESGWGMQIADHNDNLFVVWATFRPDGSPMWLASRAARQSDGVFRGTLERFTGPSHFSEDFQREDVGRLSLSFANGNSGEFAYSVGGISQVKPITRFVFESTGTICSDWPAG
jgi:hypothetical protein